MIHVIRNRGPEPAPETRDPALSRKCLADAKAALAAHLHAVARTRAIQTPIEAAIRRLASVRDDAEAAVNAAEAALAQADSRERDALRAWAHADGERPRPATDRRQLEGAVENARRALADANMALDEEQTRLSQLVHGALPKERKTLPLLIAVLHAEAEICGQQLLTLLEAVSAAYAELNGLNIHLASYERQGVSGAAIGALSSSGRNLIAPGFPGLKCHPDNGVIFAGYSPDDVRREVAAWSRYSDELTSIPKNAPPELASKAGVSPGSERPFNRAIRALQSALNIHRKAGALAAVAGDA